MLNKILDKIFGRVTYSPNNYVFLFTTGIIAVVIFSFLSGYDVGKSYVMPVSINISLKIIGMISIMLMSTYIWYIAVFLPLEKNKEEIKKNLDDIIEKLEEAKRLHREYQEQAKKELKETQRD
jgi:hypothetical protein